MNLHREHNGPVGLAYDSVLIGSRARKWRTLPCLLCLACALPLRGERSARTTHSVENSSATKSQIDGLRNGRGKELTSLPQNPLRNTVSSAVAPDFDFEDGQSTLVQTVNTPSGQKKSQSRLTSDVSSVQYFRLKTVDSLTLTL